MATLSQTIQAIKTAYGADLVLCYATGDRPPAQILGTVVATDTLDLFRTILQTSGKQEKIVLAVMTNGGNLEAPWPIISLIREYCDDLSFIVLEKALSAGTLMALGADKIIMTPGSYISPIDPKKTNNSNGQVVDIEVEDVIGYIDLIKDRIGTDSPEAAKSVIDNLTKQIPPTELGSIYRAHALIRMLSEKLLNLHKERLDSTKIRNIVKNLTEQLFSHSHLISRNEAKDSIGFGNVIEYPDDQKETKIHNLNSKLKELMEIGSPFNPTELLGGDQQKDVSVIRAVLSSGTITYLYKSDVTILANPQDPNQPMVNMNDKGWTKE